MSDTISPSATSPVAQTTDCWSALRPGGTAGGGLAYAAVALARKKKAGGLPQQVLLAVTPDRLYAFECKLGGKGGFSAKKEVAV